MLYTNDFSCIYIFQCIYITDIFLNYLANDFRLKYFIQNIIQCIFLVSIIFRNKLAIFYPKVQKTFKIDSQAWYIYIKQRNLL